MNSKLHRFTNVTAVIVFFVVFVFGVFTNATASNWLTPNEIAEKNLIKVWEVGQEVGNAETLQAILLQESSGVTPLPRGKQPSLTHSYGLMQVQINSAKSTFNQFPELMERYFPQRTVKSLSNKEVMDLLVTNDDANIRIAAYHLNLYIKLSNGNWERAVAAYNVGIGAVKKIGNPANFGYVKDIKKRLLMIKPFNALHDVGKKEPEQTVEPESSMLDL